MPLAGVSVTKSQARLTISAIEKSLPNPKLTADGLLCSVVRPCKKKDFGPGTREQSARCKTSGAALNLRCARLEREHHFVFRSGFRPFWKTAKSTIWRSHVEFAAPRQTDVWFQRRMF